MSLSPPDWHIDGDERRLDLWMARDARVTALPFCSDVQE
jgi:hypothetical protein